MQFENEETDVCEASSVQQEVQCTCCRHLHVCLVSTMHRSWMHPQIIMHANAKKSSFEIRADALIDDLRWCCGRKAVASVICKGLSMFFHESFSWSERQIWSTSSLCVLCSMRFSSVWLIKNFEYFYLYDLIINIIVDP